MQPLRDRDESRGSSDATLRIVGGFTGGRASAWSGTVYGSSRSWRPCLDGAPFAAVFAGGAVLARAHRVIWRAVEGVDFKTVPDASAPMGRSAPRRQLDSTRPGVYASVQGASFAFDPADKSVTSGDGGRKLRVGTRWVLAEAPLRRAALTPGLTCRTVYPACCAAQGSCWSTVADTPGTD